MLPILHFNDNASFAAYLGKEEISQANNLNANARLFVVNNSRCVAKIYNGFKCADNNSLTISFLPGTDKNIENLIRISELLKSEQCPQIALPTALIVFCGQVVGYEMPYILGENLESALRNSKYSHKQRISWFNQLAEVILSLPEGVFIGDLHPQNVLINDKGEIILIDVDGFSLASSNLLTCPAAYIKDLPSKYYDEYGRLKVSRNTDILCLFWLFFRYLFDGQDVFIFPSEWRTSLLEFLFYRCRSELFVESFMRLFSEEKNDIYPETFSCWEKVLFEDTYNEFLCYTGLNKKESLSKHFLETYINSR